MNTERKPRPPEILRFADPLAPATSPDMRVCIRRFGGCASHEQRAREVQAKQSKHSTERVSALGVGKVPRPLAGTVRAFTACAATTPFADSCHLVRSDLSLLSLDSKTDGRSPKVSSTAFDAQPLDLHSVPLMDRGFAAIGQLARTLPAAYPVLVHRLASLLHASFRPHLAVRPLRFAITSPPSGCEEDLHLVAVEHAWHTNEKRHDLRRAARFPSPGSQQVTFCSGLDPRRKGLQGSFAVARWCCARRARY